MVGRTFLKLMDYLLMNEKKRQVHLVLVPLYISNNYGNR